MEKAGLPKPLGVIGQTYFDRLSNDDLVELVATLRGIVEGLEAADAEDRGVRILEAGTD
jgi:hypothetical protein